MTSQLQVLNKVLQNKDYSMIEMNNLSEDMFFNYKAEFNYIKNHYKKYGQVPDRLTFLNVFPDFDITDVSEPDSYLLEQLVQDYKESFLAKTFNEVKKLVESGKTNEAVELVSKVSEKGLSLTTMTCTDLFEDTGRYERYLDRVKNRDKYYISTGFRELDDMIGGIDIENENMVIAARTGKGKSWTLLKIAAAAALQGKTVGIYSGEMATDKVGYRIDTLLAHIDNNVITRGKDTSVQLQYRNYLEDAKESLPGRIKVITPHDINGPATVSALRSFVEKYHIDILLIDQYSLLEDESKATSTHEKVANISKDVKNLQVMKRIPIISVAQMNRTQTDDKEQDSTQIGLSDRIGQDATTIIMLSREQTYLDEAKTKVKDDKLIINVVKSRDGGNGKLVYLADFNHGVFTPLDPSKETDASYYSEEVRDSDAEGAGNRPF